MSYLNRFTIIGYGNQAKAWAMNLRDSGVEVHIGLREGSKSESAAKRAGFKVFHFQKEPIQTKAFALLTPDDTHLDILESLKESPEKLYCVYAHGFSMLKEKLHLSFPNITHLLLAPKSIASELRFRYETKENLTAFYALEHADQSDFKILEELSELLGINHIYPTSFEEETKADLFSEQSILCSLIPYGINEAYNTLIERGYNKELAFFECFYESKLILDTIFKLGPQKFFDLISPKALLGSQVGKELLFSDDYRKKLNTLLDNIEGQQFNSMINESDFSLIKSNVSNYWQKQNLNETYNDLKGSL